MDKYIIPFAIMLGLNFFSRSISVKATKELDQEKKAELVDLFSGSGIYTFAALIGIIAFFFASNYFHLLDATLTNIIYFVLLVCFITTNSYVSYKKLKHNNFSDSYIKSYILATALRFLGLMILVAFLTF